jgi:hypothetical protein
MLTIVVADGFGGMGVMARLLEATGVQAGLSSR